MKRPNIVFLFSDQQRWDTCGCYGQPLDTTPNLDRMAAEGVRFEHSYTCQPVCGPARSSLQTGMYAVEAGCPTNGRPLPLDAKTIAHYIGGAGYDTAYIGKWHLATGQADRPVAVERRGGYDFWLASDILEFTSHGYDGHMWDTEGNRRDFPEGRYRVDAQTDWVLEYLDSRKEQDKPFFLLVSYIEPHHQNDHQHYEGPHGSKEKYRDFPVPGDLEGTEGDWREEYPDYLGCINSLDQNVGRIRDKLKRMGIEDDTLVIYTSDHGSHFKTRNDEYKRSCHDASIRTPLIMHGPGFTGGRVIGGMASLIDLPPTLLTAAGVKPPETMRGRPLQELAAGVSDWPDEVFIQISETHCGRAIRTRRWKYSVRAPGQRPWGDTVRSDVYVEDFLYDLEADPHERNNLVADPGLKDVRAGLAEALKRRMEAAGESVPEIRASTSS